MYKLLSLTFLTFFIFSFGTSAKTERKLVVVPGILGSELSDSSGEIIWGSATSLSSSNFSRLNLLPVGAAPERLSAQEILEDVPMIFGAFSIDVYSGLLDFLTGTPSGLFPDSEIKGNYVKDETLFIFPYDWRRSIFANASHLNEFVKEKIPDDEDFDLIAHSMGGLVTRAFLSEIRPSDICTSVTMATTLTDGERDSLCYAVYGELGDGDWPTDAMSGPFSEISRLHTFFGVAVPHRGSVNVAATLTEGWGRLSEILAGGKRELQNTVLSMVGAYELAPSYKNCCARGESNSQRNTTIKPLDHDYWANLVLGFGKSACPYAECRLRRELLSIGLNNRALLDQVIAEGLPASVQDAHIVVGRLVKGTKSTVYVGYDAVGDGDSISYRSGKKGDGTVYEGSALADGAKSYVLRTKHAFIMNSEELHRYLYSSLINPVEVLPPEVAGLASQIAGGAIDAISLSISPQIAALSSNIKVSLDLDAKSAEPFNIASPELNGVVFELVSYKDSNEVVVQNGVLNGGSSGFRVVIETEGLTPVDPGVYSVKAMFGSKILAQDLLYVSEE